MRERNFTLPAHASPAQVREFVSYWRGCAMAVEPLRHVLDKDRLVDAYTADMTTVLDALEATQAEIAELTERLEYIVERGRRR